MIGRIKNVWLRRAAIVFAMPFILLFIMLVVFLDAAERAVLGVVDARHECRDWWTEPGGGREDIIDAWRRQ